MFRLFGQRLNTTVQRIIIQQPVKNMSMKLTPMEEFFKDKKIIVTGASEGNLEILFENQCNFCINKQFKKGSTLYIILYILYYYKHYT